MQQSAAEKDRARTGKTSENILHLFNYKEHVFVYHLKLNYLQCMTYLLPLFEFERRDSQQLEKRDNQRNTRKIKISVSFPPRKIKIVDCLTSQYSQLGQGHTLFQLKLTGNEIIISTSPTYLTSRLTRVSANTIIQFKNLKEIFTSHAVTVVDIIKSKYFVTILNFLLNLKNW